MRGGARGITRAVSAGALILASASSAAACPECRARVEGGIYGPDFSANLFVVVLPVLVIVAVGVVLYHAEAVAGRFGGGRADG